MATHWGSYRSGQTGLTVNQLAYAFGGSNPPLPTGDHWVVSQSERRLLRAVWLIFTATTPLCVRSEGCWLLPGSLPPNSIADIHARVAQGQSTILVRLGSRVQFPSRAPTVPPLSAAPRPAFASANDLGNARMVGRCCVWRARRHRWRLRLSPDWRADPLSWRILL